MRRVRDAATGTSPVFSGESFSSPIFSGESKRKLRANRLNKPAGTGPTSAVGKARAARNARKHGLNVPVHYDPLLCADIEAIAGRIAPGCRDAERLGIARRIAAAQADLIRVARARCDTISAAMIAAETADGDGGPACDAGGAARSAEKLAAVLCELTVKLMKLDRYERRALSRRKRAIRVYDGACDRARRTARRRRPAPP